MLELSHVVIQFTSFFTDKRLPLLLLSCLTVFRAAHACSPRISIDLVCTPVLLLLWSHRVLPIISEASKFQRRFALNNVIIRKWRRFVSEPDSDKWRRSNCVVLSVVVFCLLVSRFLAFVSLNRNMRSLNATNGIKILELKHFYGNYWACELIR